VRTTVLSFVILQQKLGMLLQGQKDGVGELILTLFDLRNTFASVN
jgi:hypothetical protein